MLLGTTSPPPRTITGACGDSMVALDTCAGLFGPSGCGRALWRATELLTVFDRFPGLAAPIGLARSWTTLCLVTRAPATGGTHWCRRRAFQPARFAFFGPGRRRLLPFQYLRRNVCAPCWLFAPKQLQLRRSCSLWPCALGGCRSLLGRKTRSRLWRHLMDVTCVAPDLQEPVTRTYLLNY